MKFLMRYRLLGVLILLSFRLVETHAQTIVQLQNFTQKDGLSSNFVLSILQDREGFMWIGTENGLNRFDGQHFLWFRSDPEDPHSLNGNWIWKLLEDHQQQLWIVTEQGLNLLNKQTGKIERVPLIKNGQSVKVFINGIYETTSGLIWLSSSAAGLFKLEKDQNDGTWRAIHFDFKTPAASNTFKIAHATANEVWLVHTEGFYEIDIASREVTAYPFPVLPDELFAKEFYANANPQYVEGEIFLGSFNQLYVLDITKDRSEVKTVEAFSTKWGLATPITGACYFERKDVLFYPSDRNIALFDLESETLEVIHKEGQLEKDMFLNPIHATYIDRHGNYWIGTSGGGLYLGQKNKKPFAFYQHDPRNPHSISKGQVRSFVELENGNMWTGVLAHGLDYFIRQENGGLKKTKSVAADNGQPNALSSPDVIKLVQGADKSLWVATNVNLMRTDAAGNLLQTFIYQENDPNTISGNRVWGLAMGADGYIWAGTWQDGLNRIDPLTGEVTRFWHEPQGDHAPGSNNIRNIYIDKKQMIWIGTDLGLLQFDPKQEQFVQYFRHEEDNPNSLSNNLVWAIYEDQYGVLWVGTDIGLNRYDASSGQFERFYEKEGLPDNSIYGILEDDEGLLWVSTKNGLARQLAGQAEIAFRSLGIEEGMPTTSFLPKAYLNSAQSDELFFGSAEGMLIVRPALLGQSSSQAQLAIHELKRFKRKSGPNAVVLECFVGMQQNLNLGYDDQSVAFTLSDLNWMSHPTYKYEYQLVGFNKQWTPLEKDMQVSFSNLPPGRYSLRARAVNVENVKLDTTDLLNIRVFPPWWESWWAFILYIIAVTAIVLLLIRSYLQRQFEKKEAENLRNLDAFKNELFTNITHEFRTPLTVISGMVEQIKKKPGEWLDEGAELIQRNTRNLLDLINQILELQKIESGKLKIELQQTDIMPFLENIATQFKAYAYSKEQRMLFRPQQEELTMDFDAEKVLRIVSNLLSNAIKYTPEQGTVSFSIATGKHVALKSSQCLILTVDDNGPGIPPEQLPRIFDRFFQASTNEQGTGSSTGVGLSLTMELVKLLKGQIEVDSELGKGTTFRVYLPITRNATPAEAEAPLSSIQSAVFGTQGVPTPKQHTATDLPLALITEDNPDIAKYLQICLESQYRLELATNGQEGIDKALELIPDIIISDVMMPKKNGFELCETLKEDIRTSHIPIILLTAKSDVVSRIAGLKQGADDYLGKPFHEEELLVRMQNLLNIRAQLQARYQHPGNTSIPTQQTASTIKEDIFISKLRKVVEARIDDPGFDLNELSESLFLSRSQLGRKVKALTGRSLAVYIRSIRLHRAKELLLSTEIAVKEIAYDVGFSSPVHFSRSYTEEFGESPTNTREMGQMRK
jgi:signal transduction histidine kinase/DNA-binding response OmpR family regulator/ligand-binding sensor domain-containing protein